ncbi:MAG: MerR family transcriptional regulator [Elusimicrobia bacterium]|nr:MerR family transcriptional regulator [Elusimicrobiota bacterium]
MRREQGTGVIGEGSGTGNFFTPRLALPPSPLPPSSWGPSYAMHEVCRLTQVPSHALRYWEKHRLLAPIRTTRGHRRYRQTDVERILKIKDLFFVKKMRLEGARKALADEARRRQKSSELPLELATQSAAAAVLLDLKKILKEMLQILR